MVGLAERLPSAAGRLMQAEIEALTSALENPERPVLAIIGGAKVSTKLDLLGNLIGKVDAMILGGGMANTFLLAQGTPVGKSLCERDMADTAREIMAQAEEQGCDILLPIDARIANEFKEGAEVERGADRPGARRRHDPRHRPRTAKSCSASASPRRAPLVWNGPLGAFEIPPFDAGTNASPRRSPSSPRPASS